MSVAPLKLLVFLYTTYIIVICIYSWFHRDFDIERRVHRLERKTLYAQTITYSHVSC